MTSTQLRRIRSGCEGTFVPCPRPARVRLGGPLNRRQIPDACSRHHRSARFQPEGAAPPAGLHLISSSSMRAEARRIAGAPAAAPARRRVSSPRHDMSLGERRPSTAWLTRETPIDHPGEKAYPTIVTIL